MPSVKKQSVLPHHVGIIPDGNRRWAKEHGLPSFVGHQKGLEQQKALITASLALGIEMVTLWGFSTENWKRSEQEVSFLMKIFEQLALDESEGLNRRGIRIRVFGNIDQLPKSLQRILTRVIEKTQTNTKLSVNYCLSYGGRDEILRAIKRIVTEKKRPEDITEEVFASYLDSAGLPDPDLVIRTSGEQRLSGFMPWQTVYSELYFAPLHFPDFSPEEFQKAIDWYGDRKRRFGK